MMSVAQINPDLLLPSDISTGSSDSGSECFSSELEEDDCIAELTRQMAQYTFEDEGIQEKSWGSPVSPQSTLWSPLEWNQASPTGKSPPATPESVEIPKFASPTLIQSAKENPETGFPSKKSIIDEQIRAIQFNKLKQEQSMKLMDQKRRINQNWRNNGLRIPFQPCPPQQGRRNYGSDRFKAVFLNKPDSKTGSGTGVFLPQDVGTLSQTPKKKGCSAVLIPTRVVQALKLHLEKTGVPSRFDIDSGFPLQKESHVIPSKKESSGQKRYPRTTPAVNHQDLGLPKEWTY